MNWPQFIADLVVMIVTSALGGLLFASLGQPVITGEISASTHTVRASGSQLTYKQPLTALATLTASHQ